jgi:hypothetical protein
MGLLEDYKNKKILQRLSEEQLYAIVHQELDQGVKRDGLWAKAVSETSGDERNALAKYIKLRVQSLRDELDILIMQSNANKLSQAEQHRSVPDTPQCIFNVEPEKLPPPPPQTPINIISAPTSNTGCFLALAIVIVVLGVVIFLPSLYSGPLGPSGSSVHVIGVIVLLGAAYLMYRNI